MRELRGACIVNVRHIADESNPADIFTKILSRQLFDKHRKFILNLPAGSGVAQDHASHGHASSSRYGTGAP